VYNANLIEPLYQPVRYVTASVVKLWQINKKKKEECMKTIKKLQYMMLATIVAMANHELPASSGASVSSAPSGAKPAPITAPQNLGKITNTRTAEIASRNGYNSRGLSKAYDSIFGQPGARDSLTNQKKSAKDAVDSLSLTPETQIKVGEKTLDLSTIKPETNKNNQELSSSNVVEANQPVEASAPVFNTNGRGLRDTTSNYLRNSVSRTDVKVSKTMTENNIKESPYKDFVKVHDKVVERWNKEKTKLLDVKIESPDGSYRIVDMTTSGQRGGSSGKIISARTADGKTIENAYYPDGTIKQSVVITPRTLNMLESNSMQTRAVTSYTADGTPLNTTTFKQSIGGNSTGKVISVKEYNQKNPLEYTTYNSDNPANRKILEQRVKTFDNNGLVMYAIQVPSTNKNAVNGFANKQLITINNGQVTKIQTFNKHSNSSKDKSLETIDFADGQAIKTITNKDGKESKVFMTEGDNLTVIRVQESLGWYNPIYGRASNGTKASSVTFTGDRKINKENAEFTANEPFSAESFKMKIENQKTAKKQAEIKAQSEIVQKAENQLNEISGTVLEYTPPTISSTSTFDLLNNTLNSNGLNNPLLRN
jgi:hypothetical protein